MVKIVAVATDNDGVISIRLVFQEKSKDFLVLFKRFMEAFDLNFKAESSPENTMPFFKSSEPDTSKLL